MHGREGGQSRKRSRHMWPVPSRGSTTTTVAVDWDGSSANSFLKDGRKISVGDCALFKPPHDSPPFIGIIRWLTSDKENNLKLGVNWLYRPSEVKLGKGIALEAAPNEVFYSCHRDEIPAESLLHPCKVAFFAKGVDLPTGVSSFVCRRVYDISNKCLWWLTDQKYINDRQEVDHLLHKTRTEMHATVQQQQGTRSPKTLNGLTVTCSFKQSPDSVENSAGFSSQAKGKKRDRGDHVSEPMKQERALRSDDGDSDQLRPESMLKSEITKIAGKGGLVDSEAVERLVQFMQADKPERKIDLTCWSMLAGIVAATDKLDCLSQFVQLRGLPVLDEWLQEVHKLKVGDSTSPRDGDKSVDSFLLVLLCALEKLPVNLNALQTCNIGKSVNNLRSHKNPEIQKKARSLVDTWKKRVEEEMNINDVKSGQTVQWPAKSSRHEVSHGVNKHLSGSSEATIRSSVTQLSSSKSASVKLVPGEITPKAASASPGTQKLTSSSMPAANFKDGQTRIPIIGGISDPTQAMVKEEKSSSSSQSHTNSQCSSDYGKNMAPSGKEDARSSNAGARSMNKTTGSASGHRKSGNGLQGTSASVVQRETRSSRNSSLARISNSEKFSQSVICENNIDTHVVESNNHKLIVKIPNRGRIPAQSVSGGPIEDPSCRNSRAASPALSEKHDPSAVSLRQKSANHQNKEGDSSPAASTDKKLSLASGDTGQSPDVCNASHLPSGNRINSRKPVDSSFNSIDALIESCAYSEANASMSVGDNVGMNLLATVAAGEICTDGTASPARSPERNAAVVDNTCTNCDGISQSIDGEPSKHSNMPSEDLQQNGQPNLKTKRSLDELVSDASVHVSPTCVVKRSASDGVVERFNLKTASVEDENHDQVPDPRQRLDSSLEAEIKNKDGSANEEVQKSAPEELSAFPSSNFDAEMNSVIHRLNNNLLIEHTSPALAACSGSINSNERQSIVSSVGNEDSVTESSGKKKVEITNEIDVCRRVDQGGKIRTVRENDAPSTPQKQEESDLGSASSDQKTVCKDENLESKETVADHPSQSGIQISSSAFLAYEKEQHLIHKSSNIAVKGEQRDECASTAADACSLPPTGGPNVDAKHEFDLNEGLDDGKNGEPTNLPAPQCPALLVCPLNFPVSSAAGSLPASITVAAAAKGPFVPPEDLLRNKSELGWKGSAATSAFRPAEPRKVLEKPLGTSKDNLPDAVSCKQVRTLLDIDLNVADERILQEIGSQNTFKEIDHKSDSKNGCSVTSDLRGLASLRCSSSLDLDLNRIDEASELGHYSASNGQRPDIFAPPVKVSSSRLPNCEASAWRDFDLNNGPAFDEATVEPSPYNQHTEGNIPPPPPFGIRMNSPAIRNLSTWYLTGATYSGVSALTMLPDRGEQPFPIVGIGGDQQRILGAPTTSPSFSPDMCRGPVLSSSPAVPFPLTPFQYSVFPFSTSFPLSSANLSGGSTAYLDPSPAGQLCPPAVPAQLLGASAVSSQNPRPCVVSLPGVSNNGVVESSQKWGRQGLDLNSGPGGLDVEGRDEVLSMASRQQPAVSSQAPVEEQGRMYLVGGGMHQKTCVSFLNREWINLNSQTAVVYPLCILEGCSSDGCSGSGSGANKVRGHNGNSAVNGDIDGKKISRKNKGRRLSSFKDPSWGGLPI
ncbi:hypothetical protein Nepgr_018643 [Nepenthes gracilis]|uniref:Uncharacterized protein n=1 Tax=Nepenthes gracilis TaxID=150966 RepID=A0AAD3SUF6_NEPGR|nr:hypothetical protein Nepgr_018643 [Nepenthes gracilis]